MKMPVLNIFLKKKWILFLPTLFAVGFLGIVGRASPVEATSLPEAYRQSDNPDNETCIACHQEPDQYLGFPNGDTLSISVDPEAFSTSAHGGLTCTACHTTISGYPHPKINAGSSREFVLNYKEACSQCHTDINDTVSDNIHSKAMLGGNLNAAVCADCHNPHNQKTIDINNITPSERVQIAQTCAQCHSSIYSTYAQSVHGAGVLKENNPDVPACTDCHGVHLIGDPRSAEFRLSSVDTCSKCHTDPAIMDKYGISTQVNRSYVADFHGTTVTLFKKQHPEEQTNKAVCFDCHGFHDIKQVDDPVYGIQMKQNLLVTCQKCHPDATDNFPDSWLKHYIPSPEKAPLVYYVRLFYQIFVPTVLGGMALFVASDLYRRRKVHSTPTHEEQTPQDRKEIEK